MCVCACVCVCVCDTHTHTCIYTYMYGSVYTQKHTSFGFWSIKTWTKHNVLCESESEVTQSCPTLCDPVDCSLPGSSVHGILQARMLEWVAISFSRASSRPRDRTRVSHIGGRRFNLWATREVSWMFSVIICKKVVKKIWFISAQPKTSYCKS